MSFISALSAEKMRAIKYVSETTGVSPYQAFDVLVAEEWLEDEAVYTIRAELKSNMRSLED
ncbi:MAG: hypothetical protein E6Q24_14860 [Chitinophagaceae bacterium]|nr:MAG: hypothetical protein E6Q24_14860 [Chitinophagaceae bacterium]